MLRLRASLAFVLSAALAASPAFAARTHHARMSGHASASDSTSKRTSSRSRHASVNDSASSRHTRASRHASTRDRASDNSSVSIRTSSRRHAKRGSRRVAVAAPTHRLHGQQAIDPARVTEIQQALIREHYFTGEADGQWDETTKAAMQKYQADQGWQTKLMPDSRALKKLGLGPDYSTAINAKDSSFAAPPPTSTIPSVLSAGFAAGSGVNQ